MSLLGSLVGEHTVIDSHELEHRTAGRFQSTPADLIGVEHPFVGGGFRRPPPGEGVDHAGEGREAILAHARLGEAKLGLEGLALTGCVGAFMAILAPS